jgi:cell volume regulation protein A
MNDGQLILVAGALLVAGLVATLAAGRLRVPGLLLFLGIGMAIGSDGTGWIDFNDYELARTIGIICLALILFEGGLGMRYSELRPVLGSALSLAGLGTLITAGVVGLAATWLFDLSLLHGLLLGSIISVTDGAAIFALLRGSSLKARVSHTLEGESGFNDPLAILLVVGLIDVIQKPDYKVPDMLLPLVQELGIGLAVGFSLGFIAIKFLRRARLQTEAAYVLGTLGIAALSFGAASTLHGSGFLAIYITGVMLASTPIPARSAVMVFHQGLASLAQVAMFLVLGLLVLPSQLGEVAFEGTVLALVLLLVARPAATLVATMTSSFNLRERAVLSWAGLRGAVPMVLATFPVIDSVDGSLEFFNIVFFAVLVSTLIQGTTFEPLARMLNVTDESPPHAVRQAVPPSLHGISQVATVRPWDSDKDDDPGYPRQVGGSVVTDQILTRIDEPGALVALADGRYAVTGPIVATGSSSALADIARRRIGSAKDDADLAWWREVTGALAR